MFVKWYPLLGTVCVTGRWRAAVTCTWTRALRTTDTTCHGRRECTAVEQSNVVAYNMSDIHIFGVGKETTFEALVGSTP